MFINNATTAAAPGSRAATDQAAIKEDLNDFLKLLTTQLQHQDPLEPMNANEFTQQLVQFASVEQQIQQNANLENLIDMTASNQVGQMVSFLDKAIDYHGDQLPLSDGRAKAVYVLSEPASDVQVEIVDAAGKTVYSEPGAGTIGSHAFDWDGRDRHGNGLADGVYTLSVKAIDADGAPLDVATTVSAIVDSVESIDGRMVLMAGGAAVGLDQVVGIGRGGPALGGQAAAIVEAVEEQLS